MTKELKDYTDNHDGEFPEWLNKLIDGNCEEIGISEPISKTFSRVNEFEVDSSYRR